MRSVRKTLALFGLAIATAVALTGCIKFDVALTVSDKDAVSGQATVAVSKQLAAMGSAASGSSSTNGLFAEGNGVTSVPFDDGSFVGSTYKFEAVPLKDFGTKDSKSGSLTIVRDGDNLVTSGSFDLGSAATADSDNPFAAAMLASVASSAQMKISITYPGEVIETNGVISGKTVTWTPKFGEVTKINAVAKSPLTNWTLIFALIGAVVIIAAALIVFFVLRRKKASAAAMAKADEELNS